jgi:hypothetical protein
MYLKKVRDTLSEGSYPSKPSGNYTSRRSQQTVSLYFVFMGFV